MFRSFCVGALVGFVFGSSKKGNEVRETSDGMLTELTSSDALKALDDKKNELSDMACNTSICVKNLDQIFCVSNIYNLMNQFELN